MTTLEILFISKDNSCVPYIVNRETIEYVCDGKEGHVRFDGHYYVEDHAPPYPEDNALEPCKRPHRHSEWLPKTLEMYMKRCEKKPYTTEFNNRGVTSQLYHIIEEYYYTIEIYKRVLNESSDSISEEEDKDGEPMKICFFPTHTQTIYFRVLETKQ